MASPRSSQAQPNVSSGDVPHSTADVHSSFENCTSASDDSDGAHEELQHAFPELETAALRDRDAGLAWVQVDKQAIEAAAQITRHPDNTTSGAFIFVDEELLLGYHITHARRLGASSAPGLRTDTIQRWGGPEPSLTILFKISYDGFLRTFAVCEIAMARLSELPSADIRTIDDSFITSHFRDLVTSTQLGFDRRDQRYLNKFKDISPAASLAEYMRVVADKLVRIKININKEGSRALTIYYPTEFWEQQLQWLHSDARDIADTVRNVLSNLQHGNFSSLWVVFPESRSYERLWLSKWGPLLSRDSPRSPFHQIAADVCRGNTRNSHHNISLASVDRKYTLDRAAIFFLTKDERTVALIGGAADEANWLKQQADDCRRAVFKGWVLPIPGSEWIAKKTEELVYGIEGTGVPTKFIVAIRLGDYRQRCLLPEAGTAVRLYIHLSQKFNQRPDKPLIASQVASFVTALASGLSEAHSEAVKYFNVAQDRLQEMLHERYDDNDIDAQEQLVDTILDDKYLEIATPKIMSYIATFFRDADYSMPDADIDAKRRVDARQAAKLLRKDEHEDELDYRKRIIGWMSAQVVAGRAALNEKYGEPCTGIRVNIPSYRSANCAFFQVDAPLQPNWPHGWSQPPLQLIDMPLSAMPWKLGTYLDSLAQHMADAREVRIEYDVNDIPVKYECDAINSFNNVPDDSPMSKWWSFLLSFDPVSLPPAYDLVERFTGIRQFIDQGKFVKDEAIEAFRHARASKIFIAGGSSSGRSDFAATLVHAIKSGQDIAATAQSPSAILWTAPQVDHAVERLIALMPRKRIVRVYSFDLELRTLLKATLDTPPQLSIPERTSSTIERLLRQANEFQQEIFDEGNPATDPTSCSRQLRLEVETNPAQYPMMKQAWDLEESDPVTYRVNKTAYLEEARRLLSTFIAQADVIAATPTDLRILYDHVPDLSPCFLVVNEAGKMTEGMSLMPLVRHPQLPTLFIGDTRDAGPQAVAKKDKNYGALFTKQRETSLLHRVEAAGQLDFAFAGDAASQTMERIFEAWKNTTRRQFTREIKLVEDYIPPE
ncbi:hypothetical protein V8C44DRAFT_122261 [Trichoderma aethiopicum]